MNEQNTAPKKRKKPRWENAFLAALRETGTVAGACRAAQIDRGDTYRHRWACQEFAEEWEKALQDAATMMEDETVRRARDGLVRFKFKRNGEPFLHPVTGEPYFEIEYSDVLMMFYLKGILPEKWNVSAKDIQELRKEIEEIKRLLDANNTAKPETGNSNPEGDDGGEE